MYWWNSGFFHSIVFVPYVCIEHLYLTINVCKKYSYKFHKMHTIFCLFVCLYQIKWFNFYIYYEHTYINSLIFWRRLNKIVFDLNFNDNIKFQVQRLLVYETVHWNNQSKCGLQTLHALLKPITEWMNIPIFRFILYSFGYLIYVTVSTVFVHIFIYIFYVLILNVISDFVLCVAYLMLWILLII